MALWVHGLPVFYLRALLCEKCLISVIFCGLYFPIWTEYGDLQNKFPCSVRIRENGDQKNS